MTNIFKLVAEELGLSKEAVENAYKSYWRFIREKITSLPLKKQLDYNDYTKMRTSFNLPSLGKLGCSYEKMEEIKKVYKDIDNTKHGSSNNEYKEDSATI